MRCGCRRLRSRLQLRKLRNQRYVSLALVDLISCGWACLRMCVCVCAAQKAAASAKRAAATSSMFGADDDSDDDGGLFS